MQRTKLQDVQMAVNTYAAVVFSTILIFLVLLIVLAVRIFNWFNVPLFVLIIIAIIGFTFLFVARGKKKLALDTLDKYLTDQKVANVPVSPSTLKLTMITLGRGPITDKAFIKVLKAESRNA